MGWIDWLLGRDRAHDEAERENRSSLTLDDVLAQVQTVAYQGNSYLAFPRTLQPSEIDPVEIGSDFRGIVEGALKQNGIIFACLTVRQMVFSEARFRFRREVNGRPGELFGSQALRILERPWPGGTTGQLLARMLLDADLAGNSYHRRSVDPVTGQPVIDRLRPDWVEIVLGNRREGARWDDPGTVVAGYLYYPGGKSSGREPIVLMPEEVAHFAPIPDPTAWFRGMSWLAPVLAEIAADRAATTHKLKFFERGAVPSTVVTLDKDVQRDTFEFFRDAFKQQHEGVENHYKTLFLGGGADVKVIGSTFQQLDLKMVQGHGETRIAAAARVPPIIVGLSEGLQAATYSNYGMARRAFADLTMRPLWREAAACLARLVDVPGGAELWYDDRDIPFLQEDMQDEAAIQEKQAVAIRQLLDAGFTADSVVDAVVGNDLSRLRHSGLFSVQLHPPADGTAPLTDEPSADDQTGGASGGDGEDEVGASNAPDTLS